MAHVPHLPSTTSSREIAKALDENGAVIVEDLLDSDTLRRFNAELDPLLDEANPSRDFVNPAVSYFFGDKTRHLTAMATRSRVFADLGALCVVCLLTERGPRCDGRSSRLSGESPGRL